MPVGSAKLQILGGGPTLRAGDSDGAPLIAGGPYAGIGAIGRLLGGVGLRGDLTARIFGAAGHPHFVPAVSVGLLRLPY